MDDVIKHLKKAIKNLPTEKADIAKAKMALYLSGHVTDYLEAVILTDKAKKEAAKSKQSLTFEELKESIFN